VVAIQEGRRILANIQKFVVLLLGVNVAESIILVIGVLCSLEPPLDPLQVLWLNLVTST
jgi:magnesium-transporting ATPase (P-type)